jgi:cytochrome c553
MSATAGAAGDVAAGKAKSASCAACHGANGMSANPLWPNLAGQHAAYLVKQLEAFKSGARKDPVMSPMAAPLSKQDMENLAAYFASQTPK